MVVDVNGFFSPAIDSELCIGCDLCEKTCLSMNRMEMLQYEVMAYATFSRNEELRMESSSGGIFSEIAKKIFEHGGAFFGVPQKGFFRFN